MSQASTQEKPKGYCVIKNAVISYPNLAKPSKGNEGDSKPTYNVQIRFDRDDNEKIGGIMKAIKAGLIEKFSDDKKKWPMLYKDEDFSWEKYLCKTGKDGFPLRDGNRMEQEQYQGKAFINARNTSKPQLRKKVEGGVKRLELEEIIEEELYPGAICDVIVTFYGYEVKTEKGTQRGVGCSLQAVIKMADGERLGGGGNVADLSEYGEEIVGDDDDLQI